MRGDGSRVGRDDEMEEGEGGREIWEGEGDVEMMRRGVW